MYVSIFNIVRFKVTLKVFMIFDMFIISMVVEPVDNHRGVDRVELGILSDINISFYPTPAFIFICEPSK